jgi:outer membrane protein OmpA-like peptidoglycan-associated protein
MVKQLSLFILFFVYSFNCVSQETQDTCIDIFFEINSYKLDARQNHKLNGFLDHYPIVTQVIGFADTTGKESNNLILSQQRASGIYDVIKKKMTSASIIVKYSGESNALSNLWMNRRVQIRAYKSEPQADSENTPVKVGDTIREIDLDNIYFVPDKPILSPESVPYVETLANQLKTFSTGIFQVVGHINYQSILDSTHLRDLYELSRQRAKTVYEYLIELGIPAARMSYKGVGNSQPVFVAPKNDEERRRNMRVQIIITR